MTGSIPFELIITSASRPHLLGPTLTSLLQQVDQQPLRIHIHDDAAFPGKWSEIQETVVDALLKVYGKFELAPTMRLTHADPPRRLGLAIRWLMANVREPYVLYSQDDFVTVRPVPIAQALRVMHGHHLHHVRFNKRATMEFKETWNGRWYKEERTFDDAMNRRHTLTVSDHWYFQLGLWRAYEMQRALDFWTLNDERTRRLHIDEPENMINHFFDNIAYEMRGNDLSAAQRAEHQRTFIWGPIGEDRFIRHIGGNKEDWAGDHPRAGAADDIHTAWREIASYPPSQPRKSDDG